MLPTPPPSSSPSIPLPWAPEDRIGALLAGRLRLTSILGVGAYGVVYTAVDIYTNVPYAVKALAKIGLTARQRKFQHQEIRLHHQVSRHPNVVSLERILDGPDCIFVVIEFCPEGDLFTNITEKGRYVGNDHLVKHVFLQIVDAVRHCHSLGIYHRDLKPENILVTDHGHTVKLADFGLATCETRTSDFGCGSTFYMSPECQQNPEATCLYASAPNDVWSLGVILVNLTCGRNPWRKAGLDDSTFTAFLQDPGFLRSILPLSAELDDLLRRVFQCDPLKRISIDELRDRVVACPRLTKDIYNPAPLPPLPPFGNPISPRYTNLAPQPPRFPGSVLDDPPTAPPTPALDPVSPQPSLVSTASSDPQTPSEVSFPASGFGPAVAIQLCGHRIAFPDFAFKSNYCPDPCPSSWIAAC